MKRSPQTFGDLATLRLGARPHATPFDEATATTIEDGVGARVSASTAPDTEPLASSVTCPVALPYLGQPTVVLVEEPENSLHPARIKDVVAVLRKVSETSQVFIATHSPLVVNELEPQEIFVTTRDSEAGTRVTRLDQTPNFDERSKVYENGELWIAYADGENEAALLGGDE